MKKILSLILVLLLISCSALADLNTDRFMSAPDNHLNDGSVMFGITDMMNKGGNIAGLMLMIYAEVGYMNTNYPVIVTMFGADGFIPGAARINTDNHTYTILSFGDVTKSGLSVTVNGMSNTIVNSAMADMFRDMATSENVKFTLMGDGKEYEFHLTDNQKNQMLLIADAYDEEIRPYLDKDGEEYVAYLESHYKPGYASISVSAPEAISEPAATVPEKTYETLQVGSKGDAVKELQKYLIALGYLTGSADGVYGNGTAGGVKKFQAAEKLEETGIADSHTQAVLFSKKLPEKQVITMHSAKLSVNSAGTTELDIRFKNEGATAIDRLDFYVECFDTYGERILGYGMYTCADNYYDGTIKPGSSSENGWYWGLYGFDGTTKVRVAIHKYHTVDGETVEIPDSKLFWQTFE